VTFSAGVPTVWLGLINYATEHGLKFSTFRRTVIGGSACPPAMMNTLIDEFGVEVIHGWGMTEMSPLGTTGGLLSKHLALSRAEQRKILQKQGHAIYGVDMKIVDDDGKELPWDGVSYGHLLVRGPWIVPATSRTRAAKCWKTAGSPPAMCPPSMPMASCRLLTAARM
jgi:fatty-acyl-CoA synthase